MTKGYTRVSHLIWDCDFSIWEREMLLYLLERENRLIKEGDWFGVSDEDFINIGFGRDKEIIRKSKSKLQDIGLFEYKKGGPGRKSQYRIVENLEDKLMQYIGTLKIENNKVVGVEYRKDGNRPSTEITIRQDEERAEIPAAPIEEEVEDLPEEVEEIGYKSANEWLKELCSTDGKTRMMKLREEYLDYGFNSFGEAFNRMKEVKESYI